MPKDIMIRNTIEDSESCDFEKRQQDEFSTRIALDTQYAIYCDHHTSNELVKTMLSATPRDLLTEPRYKKAKYFIFDLLYAAGIRELDLLPRDRISYAFSSIEAEKIDTLRSLFVQYLGELSLTYDEAMDVAESYSRYVGHRDMWYEYYKKEVLPRIEYDETAFVKDMFDQHCLIQFDGYRVGVCPLEKIQQYIAFMVNNPGYIDSFVHQIDYMLEQNMWSGSIMMKQDRRSMSYRQTLAHTQSYIERHAPGKFLARLSTLKITTGFHQLCEIDGPLIDHVYRLLVERALLETYTEYITSLAIGDKEEDDWIFFLSYMSTYEREFGPFLQPIIAANPEVEEFLYGEKERSLDDIIEEL